MQVFFVEQNSKKFLLKGIYKSVKLQDDKIILNKEAKKLKSKIKLVNKIEKIIRDNYVDAILVEKKIKEDKDFVNLLTSSNIDIINGNVLYKYLIGKIIEKQMRINELKYSECQISIASNDINRDVERIIKEASAKFKNVQIITNNLISFKDIAQDYFDENGISIVITNNKRKALLKSNIILNLDFSEELLNRYTIPDNSIIISIEEKIKINKKRFCGKIISDYKINFKPDTEICKILEQKKYEKYDLKDITECYIKNNPDQINNIIIC